MSGRSLGKLWVDVYVAIAFSINVAAYVLRTEVVPEI